VNTVPRASSGPNMPAGGRAVAAPAPQGAMPTCRKIHPPLSAEQRAKREERRGRFTPEQIADNRARQLERNGQLTPEQVAKRRAKEGRPSRAAALRHIELACTAGTERIFDRSLSAPLYGGHSVDLLEDIVGQSNEPASRCLVIPERWPAILLKP
jgi:hypothetical protein